WTWPEIGTASTAVIGMGSSLALGQNAKPRTAAHTSSDSSDLPTGFARAGFLPFFDRLAALAFRGPAGFATLSSVSLSATTSSPSLTSSRCLLRRYSLIGPSLNGQ